MRCHAGRPWVVLAVASLAAAPVSARDRSASVAIDHAAVGCVVADRFPRLTARVEPVAEVGRVRALFRPAGTEGWYSVLLKAEGDAFAGVLPRPRKELRALEYYIEATDRAFEVARTAEFRVDVVPGPGACPQGKVLAGALASASVVLEAPAGAAPVPAGFAAAGVAGATAGLPTAAIVGLAAGGAGVVGGVAAAAGAGGDEGPAPLPTGTFVGTLSAYTDTKTYSYGDWRCVITSRAPSSRLVLDLTDTSGTGTYDFGGTVVVEVTSGSTWPLEGPDGYEYRCNVGGTSTLDVRQTIPVQLSVAGSRVSGTATMPPQTNAYPAAGRAFALEGTRAGTSVNGTFTMSTVLPVWGWAPFFTATMTFSGGTFAAVKQ